MKLSSSKYTTLVEYTPTGFSACVESLNAFTTGTNETELTKNLVEAVNLALEDEGVYVKPEQISLEFNFADFFKPYRVINARFLALRIGMNPTLLSQYIQGKKKPSQKQLDRILTGLNGIGRELSKIRFSE